MTYEELKIQLDLNNSIDVLKSVGRKTKDWNWFVICDRGDCHLFDNDGNEIDIKKIKSLYEKIIPKNIKKIIIPDSVESIENNAFFNCTNLTSINISNSIKNIKDFAFEWCESLTSINIPDLVEHIEKYAFGHCENLTSINISDSVEYIGNRAFYDCKNLKSITIPNSIKYIGYHAFCDCVNLKSIIFKGKMIDQVKSMENYPFGIEDESIIKCIN